MACGSCWSLFWTAGTAVSRLGGGRCWQHERDFNYQACSSLWKCTKEEHKGVAQWTLNDHHALWAHQTLPFRLAINVVLLPSEVTWARCWPGACLSSSGEKWNVTGIIYHIGELYGLGAGFLVPPELCSTVQLLPAPDSTCTGSWSSQVASAVARRRFCWPSTAVPQVLSPLSCYVCLAAGLVKALSALWLLWAFPFGAFSQQVATVPFFF